MKEKKRKAEENKIPMHRIGEPNEIAKVALFLASDAAITSLVQQSMWMED